MMIYYPNCNEVMEEGGDIVRCNNKKCHIEVKLRKEVG